ncbi:MAG: dephospho-CoA kinase [Balneolaceae bacterium]
MVKVGITGGIGSGKTTVCKVWEKRGAFVVYSDDLAKRLMVRDRELIHQICREFGEKAYHPDGSLNRKYLADVAFRQNKVEALNRLVHPVVRKKVLQLMQKAEREEIPMFVQEAALLLNDGRPDYFDYVVLVTSGKENRILRVSKRDRVTKEEVLERISKQQDFENLAALCDVIIQNDASLEELEENASRLFDQLLASSEGIRTGE